jgi:myo-inositol-1(or 4)-monophosphatase
MGDDLLSLAVGAAREAGTMLLERFKGPARGVSSKSSPTDLVSDADRDAEALLITTIRRSRPNDGLLGEEGAAADSETGLTWVIDPLDGTINFLFGIPAWAVSVAVEDDAGGVAGAVYQPTTGEMFSAERGRGATLNGEQISVSSRPEITTALIGTGFSYEPKAREVQAGIVARVLPRVRDIRRAGSAALDLCSVACGRLDGLYEAPMERWDKAAGLLIVAEAGGESVEMPPPLDGLSPGVIASNPSLIEELRGLVLGTTWR